MDSEFHEGFAGKKTDRDFFFATATQAKLPAPCSQLKERE